MSWRCSRRIGSEVRRARTGRNRTGLDRIERSRRPMLLRRDIDQERDEHIDMTPMVDVVFQLMTFMLFTVQMSGGEKVDVPPARHGVGVEESSATFLTLTKPSVPGGESRLLLGPRGRGGGDAGSGAQGGRGRRQAGPDARSSSRPTARCRTARCSRSPGRSRRSRGSRSTSACRKRRAPPDGRIERVGGCFGELGRLPCRQPGAGTRPEHRRGPCGSGGRVVAGRRPGPSVRHDGVLVPAG